MIIAFNGPALFDDINQPFDGPILAEPAVARAVSPGAQSVSDGKQVWFLADAAASAAVAVPPATVTITTDPLLDRPPTDWPVAAGEMHFRLDDPVLGRLELMSERGWIVREYEFAPPEVREVTYNNAYDDGTFDFSQFIGSRAVTLDIVLRGSEFVNGTGVQRSEAQMKDRLLAYAHPMRRPTLTWSEHGDSRVKEVELRGSDFSAAVTQPRFNSVNISWVAPRGLIQSNFLKCEQQILGELAGTKEFALNNEGNTNAHWTVAIRGEVQMPIIWLDTDRTVALELEFAAGIQDDILISSIDRSVRVNGVRTGYKYLADDSQWFTIPPGIHTMSVGSADYTRQGYQFAKWENDGIAPLVTWAGAPPHKLPYEAGVPPPWAWTSGTDPGTGAPGVTSITVCYRSTWI